MPKEERCPRGDATIKKAIKKNPRENLKAGKEACPLDVIDRLENIAETGYEEVPEEDFVLLKWWGVLHEKPKVGKFSLRIGIPGGKMSPDQLRTAGELADEYGDGKMKITTRQGLHIFKVDLNDVKATMDEIENSGLELAGGCGDAPRNITTCPLSGINQDELFNPQKTLASLVDKFVGSREYSSLPHKFKISLDTCPTHCNVPEINDTGLIGVEKDDALGFTPLTGGGTAIPPREGRHLPVFPNRGEEAVKFVEAFINAWQENPRYRMSFAKARSKFLVDDCDIDVIRKEVESRIGYELEDYPEKPELEREEHHLEIGEQKQDGLNYIGFPLLSGMIDAKQAVEVSNLAESVGADLRTTVQQNLIFTNVPSEKVDKAVKGMENIGFSLKQSKIRKQALGCTGDPYCIKALGLGTSAREELREVVSHLEETVDDLDITINSAGCPNGCSRPWLADIGIQGTSKTTEGGERTQAFNVLLGGGRRPEEVSLARLVKRRALPEEVKEYVERIAKAYLKNSEEGQSFKEFVWDHDTDELKEITGGEKDE